MPAQPNPPQRKATPTTKSVKPANVDAYIAGFDPSVQAVLAQVRATVRQAAPQAIEVISYGMPALKMHGMLVYFAALKQHIGFYPPVQGHPALKKAASLYAGPKGNLKFPLDQPMPDELIGALTRWRLQQDADKHRHIHPC